MQHAGVAGGLGGDTVVGEDGRVAEWYTFFSPSETLVMLLLTVWFCFYFANSQTTQSLLLALNDPRNLRTLCLHL